LSNGSKWVVYLSILFLFYGMAFKIKYLKSHLCWIHNIFSLLSQKCLVSPNPACVIFGSCNYCVSTVVESTWKYIVFVTIQCLLLNTCVSVPYSTSFITTCCDYLISLWIELNFWDFILVTFEQSCTCSCENIINSRQSISWGCS